MRYLAEFIVSKFLNLQRVLNILRVGRRFKSWASGFTFKDLHDQSLTLYVPRKSVRLEVNGFYTTTPVSGSCESNREDLEELS
jgi:hypothetical protein